MHKHFPLIIFGFSCFVTHNLKSWLHRATVVLLWLCISLFCLDRELRTFGECWWCLLSSGWLVIMLSSIITYTAPYIYVFDINNVLLWCLLLSTSDHRVFSSGQCAFSQNTHILVFQRGPVRPGQTHNAKTSWINSVCSFMEELITQHRETRKDGLSHHSRLTPLSLYTFLYKHKLLASSHTHTHTHTHTLFPIWQCFWQWWC